jgi:hypothetical protein
MPETAAPEPITRAYLARVNVDDVDKKKRTIVAKINTAALDRYQTVIDPKGVSLSNYNLNRVVLWEHGMDPARGAFPVGQNRWIRPAIGPDGPELIAQTAFYDKESKKGDDFTERLFECYASGDMRAFSVRVIPKGNCSPPTSDEIRARPELADCYMMYRSSDLGEYSAVAVPGNQECVSLSLDQAQAILRCVSRGLTLPAELVSRAEETVYKPIRYALMKDGPQWHVIDERGGIISEHETREDAMLHMDQLAAEQTKTAEHGSGGDDNTTKQVQLSLPPLGGRSLADRQAELLGQVRGMFDVSSLTQQIIDRRDQARGRV